MARGDRRTLLAEMRLEQAQANYVRKVLGDSAKEIEEKLAKIGTSGNPLTRMQLEAQRSAIKSMLDQDFKDIEKAIAAGKVDAAKTASQVVSQYENQLLKAVVSQDAMRRIARSEAQRTVNNLEAALKRMKGTSYKPLSKQVYKTKQLSAGWVDDIINKGLLSGWSAQQLAKAVVPSISPNVPGGVSYAANRLARTEINNAYHAASWDRYNRSGIVEEVEWLLSSSHPEDDICNDYALDSPFKKNAVPAKPHPNCVIEGTLVQFPKGRPVAATARWHEGEIVEIGTAGGGRLAVTPNHPILTSRGWVAAGALQIGDRVIRGSFLQEVGSGANPDEEHVISKAEDVFRAMRDSGSLATSSIVRGMTEDFHGDGVVDQEVHVVTANVLLQKHLASLSFADPVAQFALDLRDTDTPFESGLSSLDERALSDDATTSSFMSTLRPETVLLRSSLSMDERESLLTGAERNPVATQPVLQSSSLAGEIEDLDDLIRGETGTVELDDGIGVTRREWSGHVYNFQTETGTYISNSILSHNCYCYIVPRLPTEEEFLDRLFAGDYGDEPWADEAEVSKAE